MNYVYYLPSGKENFYELKQTTYQETNKERIYYTLSAKGLNVYIDQNPKEFIKLSEWIIERQGYNYISQINFFKNFKIWRILKIWRKNIFRQKKIAYQNELANMLLFNNKDYNEKICHHKAYCNKILQLKILDLRVSLESITFETFIFKQETSQVKLKKDIQDIHTHCESIFIDTITRTFNNVQKRINLQNNESNYKSDDNNNKRRKKKFATFANKNKNSDKESESKNLPDDNAVLNDDQIVGFDNYDYKYKMMIKNECMNFIKMAFIFDYILLDVLRTMYLFSMQEVLNKLEEFNRIPPPDHIRENLLNKRDEYIKPPVSQLHRIIPYFQIKCKIDSKAIEKRDRIQQRVKQFFIKATPDDEFDPTAHIQLETEDDMDFSMKPNAKESEEVQVFVKKTESDDIDIELIERPHYYFTIYDPDADLLIKEFIQQINKSVDDLKIKGWRGHPVFTKYLVYLEDWDDRFGEWDNDEPLVLDPTMILSEDELFINKDELISKEIRVAFMKCDNFLQKFNPYFQLHWKQLSIKKETLLEENLKDAEEIFRLLFIFTEKNIRSLQKWIPFEEEIGMIKLTLEDHLRKDLIAQQSATVNYLKPIMVIEVLYNI